MWHKFKKAEISTSGGEYDDDDSSSAMIGQGQEPQQYSQPCQEIDQPFQGYASGNIDESRPSSVPHRRRQSKVQDRPQASYHQSSSRQEVTEPSRTYSNDNSDSSSTPPRRRPNSAQPYPQASYHQSSLRQEVNEPSRTYDSCDDSRPSLIPSRRRLSNVQNRPSASYQQSESKKEVDFPSAVKPKPDREQGDRPAVIPSVQNTSPSGDAAYWRGAVDPLESSVKQTPAHDRDTEKKFQKSMEIEQQVQEHDVSHIDDPVQEIVSTYVDRMTDNAAAHSQTEERVENSSGSRSDHNTSEDDFFDPSWVFNI